MRPLLCVLPVALSMLGCAASTPVGRTAEGAPIFEITLRMSNVYLIASKTPVLVDGGTLGDLDDLRRGLADIGARVQDIGLVIVTHAHHDHAGLARDLQKLYGAKIMLGAGDVDQARRGRDDDLRPTGFVAWSIKPLLPKIFPELEPDLVVRDPVDLGPWGIGGKVVAMPGHTRGSVVVILSNKRAFVGDEMLGGWFGGAFFASSPGEHYYQANPEQNHRNIASLVGMGIETFFLGHGGPVSRADVMQAFGIR